jgi:copper chaperone CopZ
MVSDTIQKSTTLQTVAIAGMHCGACVKKVETALASLAGVESVTVSLVPPRAVIRAASPITPKLLNQTLKKVGNYTADDEPMVSELETKPTLFSLPVIQPSSATPDEKPTPIEKPTEKSSSWVVTYKPILLIAAYLVGVCTVIELTAHHAMFMRFMQNFMGGFFLVFSFFKLLNLREFASAYPMYDVVAKRFPLYAYIYPFIELALGVLFVAGIQPVITNWVTLVVMGVSLIGVVQSVLGKKEIRCACLGTVFNLPMSTVTIIEDGLMVVMSAAMILR